MIDTSKNSYNPTFDSLNWDTHLIETLPILVAPFQLIDKSQLSARALYINPIPCTCIRNHGEIRELI